MLKFAAFVIFSLTHGVVGWTQLPSPGNAAIQISSLSGKVTNESGTAVANAEVRVQLHDNPFDGSRVAFTDSSGFYKVTPVFFGPYNVTVIACGFATGAQSLTVSPSQQSANFKLMKDATVSCPTTSGDNCNDASSCDGYSQSLSATCKAMPDSNKAGPIQDKIWCFRKSQCYENYSRDLMRAATQCNGTGPTSASCTDLQDRLRFLGPKVCEAESRYDGPQFDPNLVIPPIPTRDQLWNSLEFVSQEIGIDKSCGDFYTPSNVDFLSQTFTFPLPSGVSQLSGYSVGVASNNGPGSIHMCMAQGAPPRVEITLTVDKQNSCIQFVGTWGPGGSLHAQVSLHAFNPMWTAVTVPPCSRPKPTPPPADWIPKGHWQVVTFTGPASGLPASKPITVTAPSGAQQQMPDLGASEWKLVQDVAFLCKGLNLTCPVHGDSVAVPWNTAVEVSAPKSVIEVNNP